MKRIEHLKRESESLSHEPSGTARCRGVARVEYLLQVVRHSEIKPAELAETQHGVPHRHVQPQRRVDGVALRARIVLDVLPIYPLVLQAIGIHC